MSAFEQLRDLEPKTVTLELKKPVPHQQVLTGGHCYGKFFASALTMHAAWNRFIEFNIWRIAEVNTRNSKIIMNDGVRIIFRVLENPGDVMKIAGFQICQVDVDLDIRDPYILNYIKARLRCSHDG